MSESLYMEFELDLKGMHPVEPEIWNVQKKKLLGNKESVKVMAVFEVLSMHCSKGQRGTYRWWRDIICNERKIFPQEYDNEMSELFFGYKEFDVILPDGSTEPRKVKRSYKELSFDELKNGLTEIYTHWTNQGYSLPIPDPAKSKRKKNASHTD